MKIGKKISAEEKLAEEQQKLIQEMLAQQFPDYTNKQEYTQRRLKASDKSDMLGKNGSYLRIAIHKENLTVVKAKENNWTDEAHARYAELFPEGIDIATPDRELKWIASMEKQLAARKKAAKKAQKQREKEKREAAEARKRAAYEEALSGHNDKISSVDNQIAELTAKRDALIKAREEFMSANREFTPKKKVNRKSPGRQCARWDKDALTWIRTRIKEKDGKVSQSKEYDNFMKAFPSSSRSKKSVVNQISKQKTIWLRRESKAMAKEIGCLTQTYNQLFKMW